ncbi:MAG: HDIG domain-containing protein [Desulfuromonadales bacterium]|nr:HDIG domain-containing protein [Desulfuromonadales bacterium]
MTKDKKLKSVGRSRSRSWQDWRFWGSPVQLRKWVLVGVALLLALIIVPKGGLIPAVFAPGDIAPRDIKSPRDMLVEDVDLTRAKRDAAARAVPLVYRFDSDAGVLALERLQRGLVFLSQRREDADFYVLDDPLTRLEADLGVPLTNDDYGPLLNLPVDIALVGQINTLLKPLFERPVVANLQGFQEDRQSAMVVLERDQERVPSLQWQERVIGLNDALHDAEGHLANLDMLTAAQQQVLLRLVQQQLRPNLVVDRQETEQRRLLAASQVTPVLFQIKKGEMVVREGERINADQILKLLALRDSGRSTHTLQSAAGLMICIMLLLFVGFVFAQGNISKFNPDRRDLLFLGAVVVTHFILIKVSIFVSAGMGTVLASIDAISYYYAIPFALAAMLVRIVLNSETAFIVAICAAVLAGVLFGNSMLVAFYALVGSIVGAHGVRHCQQRTTLYRAGLWIGLTNVAMLIGLHLLTGRAADMQLLYRLGFGFAGGIISAVMVNGTIPLVELLFKYTTDIKLLELANMNAPVLRQLMIQAPGTYHHSILVGNLAESAAESIRANPLLARVAAYYHDIGKIRKPLYFIENTGGQRNKHDKLAPSMSALILTSHVKDGVDLARDNKLGSELIDIIQQHHGTALIKFFYDRAKSLADPGVQQVDERDYRYHGPKPQTREAALIMLADAVEAASRTLADPTPARIQGMVKKLINNIFIDGQLNECDLTLRDLNEIAKSFTRVLSSSFHHRVDYPEPVHIVKAKTDGNDSAAGRDKVNKVNSANTDRKLSAPA